MIANDVAGSLPHGHISSIITMPNLESSIGRTISQFRQAYADI